MIPAKEEKRSRFTLTFNAEEDWASFDKPHYFCLYSGSAPPHGGYNRRDNPIYRMQQGVALTQKKLKVFLVFLLFLLFSVILLGLFWLSTTPAQTVGLGLSYAAGLSMIFLPCTLPLVFVIVPLCMGKTYKKGFLMALLFGLGLVITITSYFFAITIFGRAVGLDRATMVMLLIAGAAAFFFGLSELKLIGIKAPGTTRIPSFIQKQSDYLKALFMGLFLGNVGAGCPNPAFYVLLTYAASVGNIGYGSLLGIIHGLGRATPLIFLAILGILGVNATGWIVRKKDLVEKGMGWGLVWVGALILVMGFYGHYWFLRTPVHRYWNRLFMAAGAGVAEYECCIEPPCTQCLEGWIWGPGVCKCRIELEKGNLAGVCPQCRKGLAEGKGVYQVAERTERPASAILGILGLGPVLWYAAESKRKGGEEK